MPFVLSVANSLFLPHILYIHVIRRLLLTLIFAPSAPLRESIPLPHLCVLSVFARVNSPPYLCVLGASARVHSSSPLCVLCAFARAYSSPLSLRSQRLCESLFLIPLCVLCVSARTYSSPLSLRSLRLCESPSLIPIFAFSAPLRESTPHPYLCLLGVFARVNSSSPSLRSRRLCESPLLIHIFAPLASLRESIPPLHSCALCAFCGQLLSPLPITPPRALVVLRFLLNNPQEAVCFCTDFTSL